MGGRTKPPFIHLRAISSCHPLCPYLGRRRFGLRRFGLRRSGGRLCRAAGVAGLSRPPLDCSAGAGHHAGLAGWHIVRLSLRTPVAAAALHAARRYVSRFERGHSRIAADGSAG